ncbi:MAG TPA: exosome complex RNA-binding protein Rrp4 [Nitrososphaerales archaeon]|nr:exosome complex RNA-binding protein Rrp4 [Nitrososphaerales archaeon]
MPLITRKQVIPGDVIASGDYRYGSYIEKRGSDYIALRIGLAEVSRDGVKLIPLTGPYLPHVDDQVVGKVIDMSGFGWEIDINSSFFGYLPASFVFGRDFSPATHDLSSKFKVGDLLLCKIEAFDRSRDPQISIRGPGLGKVPEGEIVKISPTKVPRLIGRKGYMVNMISAQTGCELKVGQNGLVVVSGPPEGILKAANAIRMIEEEAHLADLTTKVQNYLGAEAQGGE